MQVLSHPWGALQTRIDGDPGGPSVVFANSPGSGLRLWDALLPLVPAGLRLIRHKKRRHELSGIGGPVPHAEAPRPAGFGPDFCDWGRIITDFVTGICAFGTIGTGAASGGNARPTSPHVKLWVVARGINIGLTTRIYFAHEDNSADPVLNLVEQVDRRATLITRKTGPGQYRFDNRPQGDGETVFMDV